MDGFSALYEAQDYEDRLIKWLLDDAAEQENPNDDELNELNI